MTTELNDIELQNVIGGADDAKVYNVHCVKDNGTDAQDLKGVKGEDAVEKVKAKKAKLGFTCTATQVG